MRSLPVIDLRETANRVVLANTHPPRPARPMLRRAAASEYLEVFWGVKRATATLAKLAVFGGGPQFHKAGRWPLDPEELDRWAAELIGTAVASTSEALGAQHTRKSAAVQCASANVKPA